MSYEIELPGPPPNQESLFPHLAYALSEIAKHAHRLWVAYASGHPMPDGTKIGVRSGAYMRSIQIRDLGPYAWEIFSDAPYASAIESGTPEVDLKRMLGSSWKVREVKRGPHKGQRYLIIPFRHGAPGSLYGAMPTAIHDLVREFRSSAIVGRFQEPTVPVGFNVKTHQRMTAVRRVYSWGDRLSPDVADAVVPKLRAHHTTSIYSGMVRFDAPGGGQGRHSQYMTFRMMGEWSSGWRVPPRPGRFPLRTVRDQVAEVAGPAYEAALERDLSTLAQSALRGIAA